MRLPSRPLFRLPLGLVTAIPLLLIGCAPDDDSGNMVDIGAAAEQAQRNINNYAADAADTRVGNGTTPMPSPALLEPLAPPAPGQPGGLPDDRTPISEAPFAADSAQGAANVVQTYYALIGEGKYREAWALWGNAGEDSGMSADVFIASFDKFSEYRANIGAPGAIDAGAGQRYVTVPVQVYGRLKDGARPFYMIGTARLHRVADIDGATAAQKGWHIREMDIKPRPQGR